VLHFGQSVDAMGDETPHLYRRLGLVNNQISPRKRIAIGSDHVGYPLKEDIKKCLDELGYTYQDFGTQSTERTDYPLFAREVTSAISSKQADAGILICGTGVGLAITANKVKGIRAVV
jgi:ribose 5-phosphate isomerase B